MATVGTHSSPVKKMTQHVFVCVKSMFMHGSMAHLRAGLNSYQVHTILNGDLADSIICESSESELGFEP